LRSLFYGRPDAHIPDDHLMSTQFFQRLHLGWAIDQGANRRAAGD
jgi:hypothetical protein